MEILPFIFILGTISGSFANVVIYRLPDKISVVFPPSSCKTCNHRLKALDLIPILSYIVLRGTCRYCKTKFSLRYPAVEFLCGAAFVWVWYFYPGIQALPLALLMLILIIVSFIDWDTREIPDSLLITGTITGMVSVLLSFPFAPLWQGAVLGAVAGAVPLFVIDVLCLLIIKKDGFGYGDVKLMAMAGIFLGLQSVIAAYLLAFILGGVYAFYLLATKKSERDSYMPFGPFLCVGIFIALFFGNEIMYFIFRI